MSVKIPTIQDIKNWGFLNDDGVLAIDYKVWISGGILGLERKQCINSITIKETVQGSDVATLIISDPNFLFIEDNIFLVDNTIKIEMMWSNSLTKVVFNGYISAVDIDFNSNGVPTLSLTCMDMTHKMNRKKKNNTYVNTTSAEVVKKIAAEYGFQCVIEEDYKFKQQETITQSEQTDIDFLNSLAKNEVYPFVVRIVGNTLYYVKYGKLTTPVMTLAYYQYPYNVISFSPRINKETKKEEIKSASMDTGSKAIAITDGSINIEENKSSGSEPESSGSSSEEPPVEEPEEESHSEPVHQYNPVDYGNDENNNESSGTWTER